MPTPSPTPLWRFGALAVALTGLAGCASLPAHQGAASARAYHAARVGAAFSNGEVCYAPSPDLQAAYNQPYEINGRWYHPLTTARGYDVRGIASWYDRASSSSVTAMGTAFHQNALTAASRVLPLPSCVRVTNLVNGRSVLVLVDDRGPFVAGRVMDLSLGTAHALGMVTQGTTPVQIQAVANSPVTPTVATPQLTQVRSRTPPPIPATITPVRVPQEAASPAAQARLQAVVEDAFASNPARPVVVARRTTPLPQTPETQTPAHEEPPKVRHWPSAALQPALYLISADPMDLAHAREEQHRLREFGISTAQLVAVDGHSYAVKIGPMAPTSSPETYLRSLRRLRLGSFMVSRENG
ncbi:MAG: septal ring lytic transglycosylase RlpA family protein [Acidithiobacillus sp.]